MNSCRYLSQTEVENYERDGFALIDNAFSQAEVEAMIASIEGGKSLEEHTRVRIDAEGKKTKLAIWHQLGNDIWGAASTSPNLVNNVRILLHQEIAFFHGKVMCWAW